MSDENSKEQGERFFPDGMPQPMANATTLPWWEAAAEHPVSYTHLTLPTTPYV